MNPTGTYDVDLTGGNGASAEANPGALTLREDGESSPGGAVAISGDIFGHSLSGLYFAANNDVEFTVQMGPADGISYTALYQGKLYPFPHGQIAISGSASWIFRGPGPRHSGTFGFIAFTRAA